MRDEDAQRTARARLALTVTGWSLLVLAVGAGGAAVVWQAGPSMLFPMVVLWFTMVVGAAFWIREALQAADGGSR